MDEKEIIELLKAEKRQIAITGEDLLTRLVEYCIRSENEDIVILFDSINKWGVGRWELFFDIAYRFRSEKVQGYLPRTMSIWFGMIINDKWEMEEDWVSLLREWATSWLQHEYIEFCVYAMDRVSYKYKRVVLNYPSICRKLGNRLVEFEEDYLYIFEKYHGTDVEVPVEIIDALYEPGKGELWARNAKKMEEYERLCT